MKRHYLDDLRVTRGEYTRYERHLRRALKALIARADDLISAIDGATDQFEQEVSVLSDAASSAEKILKNRRGQS
jgi:hypothetical protein